MFTTNNTKWYNFDIEKDWQRRQEKWKERAINIKPRFVRFFFLFQAPMQKEKVNIKLTLKTTSLFLNNSNQNHKKNG